MNGTEVNVYTSKSWAYITPMTLEEYYELFSDYPDSKKEGETKGYLVEKVDICKPHSPNPKAKGTWIPEDVFNEQYQRVGTIVVRQVEEHNIFALKKKQS